MSLTTLRAKIILGTVQLGLPYGINNKVGKPDVVEAHSILDKAMSEGISCLDSAEAYGDSLQVIGAYLKKAKKSTFNVISKFIGDDEPLEKKLNRTLVQLGIDSLYALMFHRFSDYQSGKYSGELSDLRNVGKIRKIGLSLYSEAQLEAAIEDSDISILQLPFNPFDASDTKKRLLRKARERGKEIHVRSVFLQGLFFKDPDGLTGNLKTFKQPLQLFNDIVNDYGIGVRETCLNYALHQSFVDNVIIGVETSDQLEENLHSILDDFPQEIIKRLEAIVIEESSLLNPSNWKP